MAGCWRRIDATKSFFPSIHRHYRSNLGGPDPNLDATRATLPEGADHLDSTSEDAIERQRTA